MSNGRAFDTRGREPLTFLPPHILSFVSHSSLVFDPFLPPSPWFLSSFFPSLAKTGTKEHFQYASLRTKKHAPPRPQGRPQNRRYINSRRAALSTGYTKARLPREIPALPSPNSTHPFPPCPSTPEPRRSGRARRHHPQRRRPATADSRALTLVAGRLSLGRGLRRHERRVLVDDGLAARARARLLLVRAAAALLVAAGAQQQQHTPNAHASTLASSPARTSPRRTPRTRAPRARARRRRRAPSS